MIEQIYDPDLKKTIAREILEALREWFEVDESREKYIADCADWIFFAAKEEGKYAGFLCLKETGSISLWDSKNSRSSKSCGIKRIPARST